MVAQSDRHRELALLLYEINFLTPSLFSSSQLRDIPATDWMAYGYPKKS